MIRNQWLVEMTISLILMTMMMMTGESVKIKLLA